MPPMIKNTFLARLKLDHPIIQGPFGGGFSTPQLTAAVANAGGLGSFGAHNLTPEEILIKAKEIREQTDRSFSLNLWIQGHDKELTELTEDRYKTITQKYQHLFSQLGIVIPAFPKQFGIPLDEQIDAVLEARPAVFSFVFGVPSPQTLKRYREKNIFTIGAATTVDEALYNQEHGVDAVVMSGFEAGGHRPSFLKSSESSLTGLATLVSQASQKVHIPLIAAGGISTGKDIAALLLLGAQAAQLGSAFLACNESGANDFHREALFKTKPEDTVLSRLYTGRLARFIKNDYLKQGTDENRPYLPYPAQNSFLAEFKKMATQKKRADLAPLYAGQGTSLLKHKTTKQLMNSLVDELYQFTKKGENHV